MKRQNFDKFGNPTIIQPERVQMIIPAFTLSASVWAGASVVLAEYEIGNDYYFSFKKPVPVFGENFVAAVRWHEGDDTTIRRFKFWADPDDLDVLYYPIYAGEKVGLSAVIEIWSVNTASMPTLDDDETLETSVLTFPSIQTQSCGCTVPSSIITLTQTDPSVLPPGAYCNPFCDDLC